MGTRSVALDNAIEKGVANKLELEAGIVREREQIELFQAYIDGVKEHPFSVPDLRDGINQSHENIVTIQEAITRQAETIESLRQQLDDAVRETEHIIIELTERGTAIRHRKQDSDNPNS